MYPVRLESALGELKYILCPTPEGATKSRGIHNTYTYQGLHWYYIEVPWTYLGTSPSRFSFPVPWPIGEETQLV